MPALVYAARSGIWSGLNAPIPPARPVDYTNTANYGLASGEPLPGVDAGLLDPTGLQEYNAPSTTSVTMANGTVLSDQIIYGDVSFSSTHTADSVFTNCLFRGGPQIPSTNSAVIKADGGGSVGRSGTGRVILADCEVSPQTPALNRDGVRGHRVHVYRSYIHDVIDGFFGYALTTQNAAGGQPGAGVADSRLMGCVIERLRYMYPDYDNGVSGGAEHIDGTHNDNVVIGSKGVWVRGNSLRGTSVDLPGSGSNPTHPDLQASGYSYGQIVLITYTGSQTNATSIFEENWLYGGVHQISVIDGNTGSATIQDNRHYREVFVGGTSNGYWVRYPPGGGTEAARAAAYPAVDSVWVNGPYATDTLTTPRDLGISVG